VARYTKDDWKRMQAEIAEWSEAYTAVMEAGEPATGERAMELAEAHRLHISTWFYECTYEIHRGLGEMYVSDPQFRAYYESIGPGLAEHLRDAINANAERRA
jgi:hypothetical protein